MPNYGNEIASISLGSIIGGALNAIVEAQSQAANTTVEFIKSVGFTTDKATGVMEPVYVDFQYAKGQVENEMPAYHPARHGHGHSGNNPSSPYLTCCFSSDWKKKRSA